MRKKILLGISGSVAAHKIPRLVEKLVESYDVKVVISKNATRFVSVETLEIISSQKVHVSVFDSYDNRVTHVEDAREADLFVIAPASANTIGKLANGIADNMLCASFLVADPSKVVICPAMNDKMYYNKRVQANLKTLKDDGVREIKPIECRLASGDFGIGGLAEDQEIIEVISSLL